MDRESTPSIPNPTEQRLAAAVHHTARRHTDADLERRARRLLVASRAGRHLASLAVVAVAATVAYAFTPVDDRCLAYRTSSMTYSQAMQRSAQAIEALCDARAL